jgi:hypothetical protein
MKHHLVQVVHLDQTVKWGRCPSPYQLATGTDVPVELPEKVTGLLTARKRWLA